MIAETSQLAFKHDVVPTLGARQQAVMECLSSLKEATNLELSKHLDWPINTVTPRINELVKLGVVEQIGKRPCKVSGRLAYVWGLKKQPSLFP